MKKVHALFHHAVSSKYALPLFIAAVFIEPFFIMPTIAIYTMYGIEMPKRALWYALLASIVSVIGAACAYWFAYWLSITYGLKLLHYLISPEKLDSFKCYCTPWVIASSSFLPVPFKFITIPAGFLHLPFITFIASVAIGRFARFMLLGIGLSLWGQKLQKVIDRYFYYFVALTMSIIIALWWFFH